MSEATDSVRVLSPTDGEMRHMRVQHVQFEGWHTVEYLKFGQSVAILPTTFDPATETVAIVKKPLPDGTDTPK